MSTKGKLAMFVLALANLAIAAPDWVLTVTLQKGAISVPLTIGGAATATNGFDSGLDELSPPAPPSTSDYFAYFSIVDPLFTMLTTDIRGWVSPYNTSIEWKIVIMNSGGAQTTFSWNQAGLPAQGYFFLNGVNMRSTGSTTFSGDGQVLLKYEYLVSRQFSLIARWNMISLNLQPQKTLPDTLLKELAGNLVIMKNNLGKVYWPDLEIDQIENWNYKEGYQLYVTSAASFTVLGIPVVPENTPMALGARWNMIAYLRESAMPITTALAGLGTNLVIAKNGGGKVYWPDFEIDNIGDLLVGQGYQIYLTSAATLTYPANTVLAKENSQAVPALSPVHYAPVAANTGSNAVLLLQSGEFADGDEIAAWAGGMLAGCAVARQGRALITVWGDDPMTMEKDGAGEGETLSFTRWTADQNEEEITCMGAVDRLTGTVSQGEICYRSDAVLMIETRTASALMPLSVELLQNYPNPFNPTTTISFRLREQAAVDLAVFNIAGERVKTLCSSRKAAGTHKITWNAITDEGRPAPSGLYWLVLKSSGEEKRIKMILMK